MEFFLPILSTDHNNTNETFFSQLLHVIQQMKNSFSIILSSYLLLLSI